MADKVTPGQSIPRSLNLWNNIIGSANEYAQRQLGEPRPTASTPIQTDIIKIKNSSGVQVRLGEVLELSGFLLTGVVRESLWFDGDTPDGTRPFAIALQDIPGDSIDVAQVSGACVALVNVTDAGHEYAEVASGEPVLQSAATGPVRILYKPTGTGEKTCAVLFVVKQCCSASPCWEWSDNFNRADSTDVGANWNEVVGAWEILSNELHETGTANAKLFCTQAVPSRSPGEMYIAIDVCDPQAGDAFFIYPSCPDTDSVGDVSVSFTFDGTSTWDIAISAGTGSGASEQTKTTPFDGKVGLYVCCDYTSGSVFAGVEGGISTDPDVGPAWADNAVFTAGRYCAIGHNNAGGATFEDFFIYELRISATRLCLTCGCSCDGIVPSKTLVGTVTSGTDRAACLEGEDWEMYWSHGSGASYWEGDLVSAVNTPTTTITYRLICDGSDYDSSAWKAPGTVASGITLDPGVYAWNDPNNAKVDDDFNYTTADTKSGEPTQFLKCTNFGFSLPADVTIVGVEVNIQRMASVAGDVEDYGVYLFNSDASPIGDNKKDPDAWPGWGMEESVRYGASNDTWSRALTKAIVEGSAFGVIIAAVGKSGTLRTAEIDYVEMKLYYKHRPGYNWKLSITNGTCCTSNPGGCSAVFRANAGSACNPLSLNFGPFYLARSDGTCYACYDPPDEGPIDGMYYISVTDPAPA